MITRIREVRKAKGMTLHDVARACRPATTAQTIGRLETGTRTVSVGWLNRIADALKVDASELVAGAGGSEIAVAAILGAGGQPRVPTRTTLLVPPKPGAGTIGVTVATSVGDYRAGDEIWCEPLASGDYARALNRDVLVPRPAGRFLFGRLIDRDGSRLLILPLGSGGRQQVVADPAWLAVAVKLIRAI